MRNPSVATQVSCVLLSMGFACGCFVSSCTKDQVNSVKSVVDVAEVACDISSKIDDSVKEVCVTEDEFKKAIRDIVSSRDGKAGSGKGTLVVKLP